MARKSGHPVDCSIGDQELDHVLSRPFRIHATQGQGDIVVAEKWTLAAAMKYIFKHQGDASYAIENPDGSWANLEFTPNGGMHITANHFRLSGQRDPTSEAVRDIRYTLNYLDSLLDLLQKPQGRTDTPNLLKGRVLLRRASKGLRRIIVAVGQQD